LRDDRHHQAFRCSHRVTVGLACFGGSEPKFGTASIQSDGRVVFNIAGNKYRLVVWINYSYRVVYVRFIGTHKQYDRIDAQTI
jgi:RelE-like HigB toxin of type II HigAB toxin-antitoxin system